MNPIPLPRIPTNDHSGLPNGEVVPIANRYEGTGPFAIGREVEQVYVTRIIAGGIKGPHLHLRRSGFFTVLQGRVGFVIGHSTGEEVVFASADEPCTVHVPAGTPSAMKDLGDGALVLNVVESAWRPEDPDDEPVADWTYNMEALAWPQTN